MVPLDYEHWTSEETPERTLRIHEHGLPHGLCQYPCPYVNYDTISYMDSLDLSDISDCEDYMVTSSDEEIPGMEEVPYWYRTLVCLNICFTLLLDYNIIYLCKLSLKEQYHSYCVFLMILCIYLTIANLYFITNTLPCKILSKWHAEIQNSLVNIVCFHWSLSRCSNGVPGNMHPWNSYAWIMHLHPQTLLCYHPYFESKHPPHVSDWYGQCFSTLVARTTSHAHACLWSSTSPEQSTVPLTKGTVAIPLKWLVHHTMTHLNEGWPLGPLGCMDAPQGLGNYLWECEIGADTFFCHSYCQARNKHHDYFITSTHTL